MRVTGGKARGLPLQAPAKGRDVRPATDRLRESLFSSLGERVPDARVLDLFAGTGSYGLEALSRGAGRVVFVENHRAALRCLRHNLRRVAPACGDGPSASVRARAVLPLPLLPGERFDLAIADPPYAQWESLRAPLLQALGPVLAEDARLVLEIPAEWRPETPGFEEVRRLGGRQRGDPSLLLLAPSARAEADSGLPESISLR